MTNETLNELLEILNRFHEDNIFSPNEIDHLQDWVDENAVNFIGDLHNKIICQLQKIIEDGQISSEEYKLILDKINSLRK